MPKFHLSETVPGAIGAPRKPVYTERKSVGKLQPMRDMIPLAPVEFASTQIRNFRHVSVKEYVGGKPTGFDADPRPGYQVTSHKAKGITVTVSDPNSVFHKIGQVWVNADEQAIRTVDMGDTKGMPGIRRPKAAEKAPKAGKVGSEKQARKERALAGRSTDEDLAAFVAERGISVTPEKLRDKRVRNLIRDLMAHEASVAAYSAK